MEKPVNAVLIVLLILVAILIVFLFFEFQELDFSFEEDISLNFTLPKDEPKIRESPHINNTKPILIAPTENNSQEKYSVNLLPKFSKNSNWKILETTHHTSKIHEYGIIEKVTRLYYDQDTEMMVFASIIRTANVTSADYFYTNYFDLYNSYQFSNQSELTNYNDIERNVMADKCYSYKTEIFEINYSSFSVNCIKENFYFQIQSHINGTYIPENLAIDFANEISDNILQHRNLTAQK